MAIDPRHYQDSRDIPKYTLRDIAWYLDIPASTLRWWCLGRSYTLGGEPRYSPALIKPAKADADNPLLSFYNLAEIHVLAATRRFSGISMQKIRDAIDYLTKQYPSPHPLIGHDFFTDGNSLFVNRINETVNLSKKGQLAFQELVKQHLDRITPDVNGLPASVFPIRHRDTGRRPIVIIPNVAGGHPITPKKGIRVSVLLNRKDAGEPIEQIADDYGLTPFEVQEAIQYMEAA